MRAVKELRLPIAALLTLAVAILGLAGSVGWIGKSFPGFLVLENRVVASAGLARWPAVADGTIYQTEVVAIDGKRIDAARDIHDQIGRLPADLPVLYTFRGADGTFEREIRTRRFDGIDFALLFGVYLLGGLAMCGVGLSLIFLRRGDPVAEGAAVALWVIGMWALTAMDLYGPYHLFRLHAGLECLLFASTLQLAMTFPYPHRIVRGGLRPIALTYGLGFLLAAAIQIDLHSPGWYGPIHRVAVTLFGLSIGVLVASQVRAWIAAPTYQARQRVKVLVVGIVLAGAPIAALAFGSALTGGRVSENAMGFSGIFLPLAIGYAVLHENLFEVDTFLRRTLNYAATSILLTALYAAAIIGVDRLLAGSNEEARGQLLIATSALALFALLPLRDRMQTFIDRLFFRNVVDLRRILDQTSEHLASVAELDVIADRVMRAVEEAVQPEWARIDLWGEDESGEAIRRYGTMPLADEAQHDRHASEVEADGLVEFGRALAVPMRVEGRLVARLYVGPRRSGRFFDGEDRRFLRTLGYQGGIAIENAKALEELRGLNVSLEQKVADRTADLSTALEDLRETQDHLLHQEKLASLGRLVAGIAHEINNPVNFIDGNLVFLREHVATLRQVIERMREAGLREAPQLEGALREIAEEADLEYVEGDLQSIFDACQEGVARTTSIVGDLRTFSRSDSGRHGRVDLAEAFDSTLSLLRGRLAEVEVVREFDDVPPLFAVEGQIKQVLMNLIDNALDAMEGRGRLLLRLRFLDGRAVAEVEDEGPGIPPDVLEHVFDPFFTTKDPGKGTGLGLAISYGAIADHGGSLRVQSEPGRTCFTLELPLSPPDADEEKTS